MKSSKCILWGGYGGGNAGDELTLAIAIRDMKARFGSSITILSPVPGYTKALFPNESVILYRRIPHRPVPMLKVSISQRIWRKLKRCFKLQTATPPINLIDDHLSSGDVAEWVSAIQGADLLYFVGGGYLTDLFDFDVFITAAEVAKRFGTKIETAPLGIGPFKKQDYLSRLGDAFHTAQVKVRDDDSLALCEQVGIKANRCMDDGFRLMEEFGDGFTGPSRNVLGFNYFVQWGAESPRFHQQWCADLLLSIARAGISIEGFSFHNQISADFAKTVELMADVGLDPRNACAPDLDFRDACRRVAGYRAIVTCRFHAAVVANVLNIPVLAIASGPYYSSKMKIAVSGSETATIINPLETSVEEAYALLLSWL